ncbi:MAG: TatD family deoxyribonuclease [Ruminococcaceae bacterium]|nr:TatD family deoxyribonuclease [Oscillospiraceae bacterium]
MKLFDSHAHYYDERFANEHNGGAEDILSAVFSGDVGWIINVGTNNENAERCVAQALRYKNMYAAVGIHPTDCQEYSDIDSEISRLKDILSKREEKKIIAIGEIGLDYHYDDTDKPKQQAFFERQLVLATELDMPVIIHDRDAHGDVFDTVRSYPGVRGVFHSYSGSAEMAKELVKMGWYISFSGVLTFKNAAKVKEVAEIVQTDRVLIETDCPYLAPHPHRGELNHSGLMHYTLEALAGVHGADAENMAKITAENAAKLFGIGL